MKRILLALILLVWALPVQAQTTTKLCFPVVVTGQNKMSCQDVSFPNPLPVTGINLSVGSLNISAASVVSATITNIASAPVLVSNANGQPFAVGPFNVTVTNVAGAPAIVTCTNCGATSVTGPFNVTITNTATSPAIVSIVNAVQNNPMQVTVTNVTLPPGNVTITNVASAPAIVTCTNCGAASVTGPFNVTITNVASAPAIVTCTNCGAASVTGPFNVTIANQTATTLSMTNIAITTANQFATLLASSTTRKACTVQYNGAGTGFVLVGAGTLTPAAFQLKSQQSLNCATGAYVITDTIQGASATTSENFTVSNQ